MKIHCCKCDAKIDARLTNGAEIYPHRDDLSKIPFWVCDACGNYVGCHHKTKHPTTPLGSIPTKEIRAVRIRLHGLVDPLWRDKKLFSRAEVYRLLSIHLGRPYHTGDINSVTEGFAMCRFIEALNK